MCNALALNWNPVIEVQSKLYLIFRAKKSNQLGALGVSLSSWHSYIYSWIPVIIRLFLWKVSVAY